MLWLTKDPQSRCHGVQGSGMVCCAAITKSAFWIHLCFESHSWDKPGAEIEANVAEILQGHTQQFMPGAPQALCGSLKRWAPKSSISDEY